MHEVYEFLKSAGVYYLTTMEGNQPRVRPFGTIDLYEDCLYIQTGKCKPVADQLKANPKIEISAMLDGRWIRLEAEAILDENIEAQIHMLDNYPELKAMYTPGDGNTEVYCLRKAHAVISSFTSAPEVYEF